MATHKLSTLAIKILRAFRQMARIRTVKPELFTHELLYEAELKTKKPCRLAFIGLFTQSDRAGRFKWRPRELKLGILPYDEIDFESVLDVLKDIGVICKYISNGECYGYIPTWEKHQSINNRERESTLPDPTGDTCSELTREAHVSQPSVTPLCITQGEGKGKEGKGKDISKVRATHLSPNYENLIDEIFKYWQQVMNHPKAKLDTKRARRILAALKLGFTVEQLKKAIDGCAVTPHNMGSNKQGKKYDDIELICRDASHIERFIQNADDILPETSKQVKQIDHISAGAI